MGQRQGEVQAVDVMLGELAGPGLADHDAVPAARLGCAAVEGLGH